MAHAWIAVLALAFPAQDSDAAKKARADLAAIRSSI